MRLYALLYQFSHPSQLNQQQKSETEQKRKNVKRVKCDHIIQLHKI